MDRGQILDFSLYIPPLIKQEGKKSAGSLGLNYSINKQRKDVGAFSTPFEKLRWDERRVG